MVSSVILIMMQNDKAGYRSFRIAVPPAFKDVFSHFYFAENISPDTITKTLLPSYQTILIFNSGAPAFIHSRQNTGIEVDRCIVLGPIKQAFDYSLPPGAQILVANFTGDAFYRFFGNAVFAGHLPLNPDELLTDNCFTSLWNELQKVNSPEKQVDYILEFCRPYLKNQNAVISDLLSLKDESFDPIKAVADQRGQTERNIQRRHKRHLGYTAKEFNRYQRFLKAIEMVQRIASDSSKMDWFEIIGECGYYDQSQLIHDFKHYLNLTPAKYLKFQQDICDPKS